MQCLSKPTKFDDIKKKKRPFCIQFIAFSQCCKGGYKIRKKLNATDYNSIKLSTYFQHFPEVLN